MEPLRIAIVLGSTRPGRRAGTVADWVLGRARSRSTAQFELVDLAHHRLPLLDEPDPAIHGHYLQPHTKAWAETVEGFDGFVFAVPEYNRSVPAALKNALDYLYREWNDKAAGIVSYGVDAGGARAAEHLRCILGELRIADVRSTAALSLMDDFTDGEPTPRAFQVQKLDMLLDELLSWSGALRSVRMATVR
ncbi:NADPH-dependent FMN reductase [Pseudonocardia spinosispora]|uniref:NADPH-dependent FMN reductase n=1 Tax=Pseudonocardia spinosispora TaxID=103441 RepID=UPI00041075C3|nr:NAD(P)H-dependent oxidoreductase [Pseudonocardia spinosispora]